MSNTNGSNVNLGRSGVASAVAKVAGMSQQARNPGPGSTHGAGMDTLSMNNIQMQAGNMGGMGGGMGMTMNPANMQGNMYGNMQGNGMNSMINNQMMNQNMIGK
jgi:hypothetical protein